MPPVPAACSAIAERVAALEAEEASVRATVAGLTGFSAWKALARLGRLSRTLAASRKALTACIEHADTLFPGELVVIDLDEADPNSANNDRVIELWESTSSGVAVREFAPVTGTAFSLTRPLPEQFGITVLATDMAGLAAGSDTARDFRSAPISPGSVPADGPLRIEVLLGPTVRLTAAEINAWIGQAIRPHRQPLHGVPDAVVSVAGASAGLVDGGIRGTITGSITVRHPLLGSRTVPFSISVGVGVRISTVPLSPVVELSEMGSLVFHTVPEFEPLTSVLSNTAGAFVTGVVLDELRQILQRELPKALAEVLALLSLPDEVTLTIRKLSISPEEMSFQPTLGAFGTALSTFTPPPFPPG